MYKNFEEFRYLSLNLKWLREQRRQTQQNVADALGIDRSSYAYLESGRNFLSLKHLIALSKFYRIPVDEICLPGRTVEYDRTILHLTQPERDLIEYCRSKKISVTGLLDTIKDIK